MYCGFSRLSGDTNAESMTCQ